jgi:anti-sigma factor RsiW
MTTEHSDETIGAYVDGELPDAERLAIEAHLASCPACATLAADLRRMRQRLFEAGPAIMPATLGPRIRAALREEASLTTTDQATYQDNAQNNATSPRSDWRRYAGIAAALMITAVLSSVATRQFDNRQTLPAIIEHDLMTAHLRALTQDGGIQVASSDSHTVRPWFAGKVDFSPDTPDLAAQGFNLVGGRLDIVDGRRVGAVIYKRRKHLIDVFAWPDNKQTAQPPVSQSRRGYSFVNWAKGGITYWAVSDLDPEELKRLASLL